MKRYAQNGALVALSLAAAFLVLEGVARLFIPWPSPYPIGQSMLVYDQRGYWINEPGFADVFDNRVDFRDRAVTVDAGGARATPCRRDKASAARKLVVVGDSETFGWGLDDGESWPNRLQCRLNEAGLDVAVHNLGVAGTNLDQYYFRVRHFVDGLGANDVVLFIVTWNDFHTTQSGTLPPLVPFACDRATARPAVPGAIFPACLADPIQRYQGETTWRKRLYERTGVFVPAFDDAKTLADSLPFASAVAHVLIPRARMLYYRFRGSHTLTKVGPETFEANGAIMGKIGAFLGARKIAHHFVFLPSRVSFDDALYANYSQGGTVFPEQDFLHHYGRPICAGRNLSCRSLFEALRGAPPNGRAFAFDGHLDPRGADAVAGRIFRWFVDGDLDRPVP